MNLALEAEAAGDLVIDVGDFNQLPTNSRSAYSLFPDVHTFRLNSKREEFQTTIDGAMVTPMFAPDAFASALPPVASAQHRPVAVFLGVEPHTHRVFRWRRDAPIGMTQEGTLHDETNFINLLDTDIDGAWTMWFNSSGLFRPTWRRESG